MAIEPLDSRELEKENDHVLDLANRLYVEVVSDWDWLPFLVHLLYP
jgi:hypothetical protein